MNYFLLFLQGEKELQLMSSFDPELSFFMFANAFNPFYFSAAFCEHILLDKGKEIENY
jgi:hypothetical protein